MLSKRLAGLLILIVFIFTNVFLAQAYGDIKVIVNDTILSFDVPPQIVDGRTLVPMRKIFEALGATVTWDEASKTATGKKENIVVNITIDSKVLFKNGEPKIIDVAPIIIDGRTLVPARAIAESFDCEVSWIEESRSVKITSNEKDYARKEILTASEIAERVSPNVFYIEVYDEKKSPMASGSGFFIDSAGVAVTNYHVIENTSSAVITTISGDRFNVEQVIAFDEELDVAIIRVGKVSEAGKTVYGFSAATLANSDNIRAGQVIYALGSPKGLQNTISNGIISNPNQIVGDATFIQITAAISHGSSGGALVNEYGEVLGITSAGIDDAQNIGFAIPINVLNSFDLTKPGVSYAEFADISAKFTIVLSDEIVEVEVGESVDILVYADGKGENWSIYWDTKQENLVECKWGEWLNDYGSICNLTIKGCKEGVATVTIYSDVDFKGVDVTVYVKKPEIEYYPSSSVNIPTFTSITGIGIYKYEKAPIPDGRDTWVHLYQDIENVQLYIRYLMDMGFKYDSEYRGADHVAYQYLTPNNIMFPFIVNYVDKTISIFVNV